MIRKLLALAALTFAAPLAAQQTTTLEDCSTVVVTRATEADRDGLAADAACYGREEARQKDIAEKARAAQSSARSSRTYREKRLAALPPTPQVPADPDHSDHGMPPIPDAGTILASSVQAIASDFDVPGALQPAWGHGRVAATGRPDVLGAFRMDCRNGFFAQVDPIVYPGQRNVGHLHFFFGNTLTDENSTYASLRAAGDSDCSGGKVNRSAYWVPAMLDGKGNAIRPSLIAIYYKQRPASDQLSEGTSIATGVPTGLRAIFGSNYTGPESNWVAAARSRWKCVKDGVLVIDWSSSLAKVSACPAGAQVSANLNAPSCWDGINLDVPDHQSHLAYPAFNGNTGRTRCPSTHPVSIPLLSATIFFDVALGDDVRLWRLSSDIMARRDTEAGTTLHMDYMEAWEPAVSRTWKANCIDKLLSCSGGDLGDGTQGKYDAAYNAKLPRLVAVR